MKPVLFTIPFLPLLMLADHAAVSAEIPEQDRTERQQVTLENDQNPLPFPVIGMAAETTIQSARQSIGMSPVPVDTRKKTPEIIQDPAHLPEPVRIMREKILAAARSGNIEALRPLIATADKNRQTASANENDEDPITFLKNLSDDVEGLEILAILINLLNAGCAHLGAGSRQEMYVWPYFAALPLDTLSKTQRVEACQIMPANDFATIRETGAYLYFRTGISADGRWQFFATGDPGTTGDPEPE